MARPLVVSALAVSLIALTGMAAEAKGCIKGAVVGGVAGHIAGHGALGAAAGCVVGRHQANKKARQDAPSPQR